MNGAYCCWFWLLLLLYLNDNFILRKLNGCESLSPCFLFLDFLNPGDFMFFFFKISVYLFIFGRAGSVMLLWFFSSCREQGLLLVAVRGRLTAVACLLTEHSSRHTGFSSCSNGLRSCSSWALEYGLNSRGEWVE